MMYKLLKNGFWYVGKRLGMTGLELIPVWTEIKEDSMTFSSLDYAIARANDLEATVVEVWE